MKSKSTYEKQKWAMAVRVRAEASILRGLWLQEVLPALEKEFERLWLELPEDERESLELNLPPVEDFAETYVQKALERGN